MRNFVSVAALVGLSLTLGGPAIAQSTHTISVLADEATAGDLGMLASAVLATADGDASQPIRKLGAALVGELRILMNQRIAGDLLTLDDGTTVVLTDGDSISVTEKCDPMTTECTGGGRGAVIELGLVRFGGRFSYAA